MARQKKTVKAKEPVRIRQKQLKGGNISLYLDIYYHGVRKYEFLELYLVPERTSADKIKNAEIMTKAELIKSERILQLQKSGIEKWEQIKRADILLVDWLKKYAQESGLSDSTISSREKMLMHLEIYLNERHLQHIRLSDVTRDFCRGFIAYLRSAKNLVSKEREEKISQNTAYFYQHVLSASLNKAVCDGLLPKNPFNQLSPKEKIPMEEIDREFLTIDEMKRLAGADCPNKSVKQAFMFSCLTGLRISDIRRLTSENIRKSADDKGLYIDIVMQKTKRKVTIPLSQEALQWLPETPVPGVPFFKLPKTNAALNINIRKWCENAEVDKHVTFHTSRHTFGTTMLTLGADLYTTSKLMGHADVSTTTVYAKIIDQKKVDSIHLLDNIFNY